MRKNKRMKVSLNNRLLLFVGGLLIIASFIIGVPSFLIAKNGLDKKGEIILVNAVEMALMLIDTKNVEVISKTKTLQEAQEEVKQLLLGPKQKDGTRVNQHTIDLGKNGYFLVYDQAGNEVMHPTLEGENVWDYTYLDTKDGFLVRDQIQLGNQGGGFLTYDWNFPGSDKIGEKYSYQKTSPTWGWVVVATAYKKDFNLEADNILQITLLCATVLLIIGLYSSSMYIHNITKPLSMLRKAMNASHEGDFIKVPVDRQDDEVSELLNGYNVMVDSLEHVYNELITREKKIKQYAYYDMMTGLPNRYSLEESINNSIDSGIMDGHLTIFEIKDFRTLNAIHGSNFGDQIILLISKLLLEYNRTKFLYGRYEGNEFIGWFVDVPLTELQARFAQLKKDVSLALLENNIDISLEFYISFASYPNHGHNFVELLKKANSANRHAKTHSLVSAVSFTDEIYDQIQYETKIINLGQLGFIKKEYSVYYQEKVDSLTNKVKGVEALARWNSEELGPVSPGVFIVIFSRSNLINELSEFVIKQALNDFPKLQEKYGKEVTLSLNISPIFFHKNYFTSFILNTLEQRSIQPHQIILEITEDVLINDPDLIKSKIKELRKEGVKISLDDFGTGYSSLNYLINMELDEVKIDKKFVDYLTLDANAIKLFKSIVDIAHSFDYRVVAEGVETKEQLELIVKTGCNEIQGFYFSKPMPL